MRSFRVGYSLPRRVVISVFNVRLDQFRTIGSSDRRNNNMWHAKILALSKRKQKAEGIQA
jgi:hypothetical protein